MVSKPTKSETSGRPARVDEDWPASGCGDAGATSVKGRLEATMGSAAKRATMMSTPLEEAPSEIWSERCTSLWHAPKGADKHAEARETTPEDALTVMFASIGGACTILRRQFKGDEKLLALTAGIKKLEAPGKSIT